MKRQTLFIFICFPPRFNDLSIAFIYIPFCVRLVYIFMEVYMISIIGIGPGGYEDMTVRAVNAIKNADVVTGYRL